MSLTSNFDYLAEKKTPSYGHIYLVCCFSAGWMVRDGWLVYIPTPCFSSFTYSTNLVRPGFVEYVYRMPKGSNKNLYFSVDVRNEQCQSYRFAFVIVLIVNALTFKALKEVQIKIVFKFNRKNN